jgi:hypothetical protein
MLVFLDLVELVERAHFDSIVYEYLETIIFHQINVGNFPKSAIKMLKAYIKKK